MKHGEGAAQGPPMANVSEMQQVRDDFLNSIF